MRNRHALFSPHLQSRWKWLKSLSCDHRGYQRKARASGRCLCHSDPEGEHLVQGKHPNILSVIDAFWVAIEKHPLVVLGVCSFCGTDGRGFCVVLVAEACVTEVTLDFADVCFYNPVLLLFRVRKKPWVFGKKLLGYTQSIQALWSFRIRTVKMLATKR